LRLESFRSGLQNLPIELIGQICGYLPQHDLAKFGRTCKAANAATERQIWRHLILRNQVIVKPWFQFGSRASCTSVSVSKAHQKIVDHLNNRPDLAQAVRRVTIPAAPMYSNHVADILNLVGPDVRKIGFHRTSDSNYIASQTHDPCRIGLDQVFRSMAPMPNVTHLNLILPAWQWVDCWKYALIATPSLQELRVGPLGVFGGIPTLEKYTPANTPSLPSLNLLSIGQMCTALEPAIIHLIKSSNCHIIRLWLGDPEGSWIGSKDFKEFLVEWNDRLNLEVALPSTDEKGANWLEEREVKEEDMMDQEFVMELWMTMLRTCFPTLVFLIALFCLIHVTVVMRLDFMDLI